MNERKEPGSLPEALLAARDHMRDVVLPQYESIGKPATFAVECLIKPALASADRALVEHDAAAMVVALVKLREITS